MPKGLCHGFSCYFAEGNVVSGGPDGELRRGAAEAVSRVVGPGWELRGLSGAAAFQSNKAREAERFVREEPFSFNIHCGLCSASAWGGSSEEEPKRGRDGGFPQRPLSVSALQGGFGGPRAEPAVDGSRPSLPAALLPSVLPSVSWHPRLLAAFWAWEWGSAAPRGGCPNFLPVYEAEPQCSALCLYPDSNRHSRAPSRSGDAACAEREDSCDNQTPPCYLPQSKP